MYSTPTATNFHNIRIHPGSTRQYQKHLNISPFFNEVIYQQEVADTLQTRKNEVTEFLEMKVKFLDDDNEE